MLLRKTPNAAVHSARAGFTLMELLVVVAILLVLVGVATPIYMGYVEKTKRDSAAVGATNLRGALKTYQAAHSMDTFVPNTEYQLENGYPPENLQWAPLLQDATLREQSLREKDIRDPWGVEFHWYATRDEGGSIMEIHVRSAGPDKTFDTPDDIYNR